MQGPKRAVFLHIQKTAGTSIMMMARERYGIDGVISHADFMHLGRQGCDPYPFISGHFGYDFAKPLLEGRYAFTFLRDPLERLISLYWFSRSATDDNILYNAAKTLSFDEFLELGRDGETSHPLRPQIWNNQTYQLAHGYGSDVSIDDCEPISLLARAKRNLSSFDFVGFTETLNSDALRIFRAVGGSPQVTSNETNTTSERPRISDLPRSTVTLLREMTELDRELYRYARAGRWFAPVKALWRRKASR